METVSDAYASFTPSSLLAFAQDALQLGICVVPTLDGEKRPALSKWEDYQKRLPTPYELEQWFPPSQDGIGIVPGQVSGNIEALDFDRYAAFLAFCEVLRGIGQAPLLDRVIAGYQDRTPNGAHLLWRCEVIEGNQKLASTYDRDERGEIKRTPQGKPLRKTIIETRGEGGFLVIPPSHGRTHPSGKPYVQVSGGLATIATISPAERDILIDVARSLNEVFGEIRSDSRSQTKQKAPGGTRPGDLFTARATWEEILEPHGWRQVFERARVTYWRRPGKDQGISATTNYAGSDLFYVFSTSTDFDSERGYSKFSAYTFLNHGGNFEKAAEDLLRKGYYPTGEGAYQYGNGASSSTDDPRQEATAEPPRPLRRPIPAPDPYPIDALGGLAAVVKKLHATIQAPQALCGQSVLAATTLAVQAYADIHIDGRVMPVSAYFLTVGESGERKSAVDREALFPHRAYEKTLVDQYEKDCQGYENDFAAFKKAREEALKKAKTREEKKSALDAIGPAPQPCKGGNLP